MITRRCSERRFFLRPDSSTNNAFIYCLAVAAEEYGVRVVFTVAMSNHHHTGIVDVHGNFPEFLAYFHKLFAKHQNALRGRWEAFWASEQTSVVELVEGEDILNKMVYAFTNPVKDHIVEKALHWPGVCSLTATLNSKSLRARRPTTFFRADGTMPKVARLKLHQPAALKELCGPRLSAILRARIAEIEKRAATERAETKRPVVGSAAVLRQHWNDSPSTREPRRQLSPRVACLYVWRRVETLKRNRTWLSAYRNAREQFLAGLKTVFFPIGTFWLRLYCGVAWDIPEAAG